MHRVLSASRASLALSLCRGFRMSLVGGQMRRYCEGPGSSKPLPSHPLGWSSSLPSVDDPRWQQLGEHIVKFAVAQDTGPEAFAAVLEARRQLETVVRACGYESLHVQPFGGIAVMGLLEVGGDADFTAVPDVLDGAEPTFEEASDIIGRLSREMRRLGLRCTSYPRARIPVVKVDRASRALPGSPIHRSTSEGLFRFSRPLTPAEQDDLTSLVTQDYGSLQVEWDTQGRCAKISFAEPSVLVDALTHIRRLGAVEIPVRVPADMAQGPELYRLPFDFCLSSTGLFNSFVIGQTLKIYPYARHMALVLKRWGRSSGCVNSMEGLLASYAITVMLTHFLVHVAVVPPVEAKINTKSMQCLSPEYVPLCGMPGIIHNSDGTDCELCPVTGLGSSTEEAAKLGYLLASFFEYYARVFDYNEGVVTTTDKNMRKADIGWDAEEPVPGRPPYYYFSIKDPFGPENIARNLGAEARQYVQKACSMALDYIHRDLSDPGFMLSSLADHAPRPTTTPANGTLKRYADSESGAATEAFRKLKRMEFHKRRDNLQRFGQSTMRQHVRVRAAQDMTRDVVSWLQSDNDSSSP